jgi:small subunit ribosomal protein S19
MAEKKIFKGMTGEEIARIPQQDFLTLIKSRQRRSIKRNGIDYKNLKIKVEKYKKDGKGKVVKTQCREAVILPSWIGMKFAVHNGKEFQQLDIVPEMIGHRLGDFVYTTKRVVHSAPGIGATRGSKALSQK